MEVGGPLGTMQGMTALAHQEADVDPRHLPMDVEIVVPVYNEAAQLAARITALRQVAKSGALPQCGSTPMRMGRVMSGVLVQWWVVVELAG